MHQNATVYEGPHYYKKLNIARGWVDCSSWGHILLALLYILRTQLKMR